MHVRATFVPHPQATKLMQPGDGAFDHPPRHAQMAAVCGAPLADLRHDATPPQNAPTLFAVVPAIGLHATGFLERWAAPTGDGRHAFEQWEKLRGVVAIGAS